MSASETKLPVVLVLARAENGVIGKDGGLPWRIRSDMAHFKAMTMGKPVIMGRKTWTTLGKPLPGRDNIVISRDPTTAAQGGHVVSSLDAALDLAEKLAINSGAEEICVIGGGEIYRATLPIADRIELTEVHANADGDTVLAPFAEAQWRETQRVRHKRDDTETADYSFVTLVRHIASQKP